MQALATLVGQYNATLLTLTDGWYGHIALDAKSRIIFDHTTASTKIGDGTDILDIVVEDEASAGAEKGIISMAVRQDTLGSSTTTDGDFAWLKVNALGSLYVVPEGLYAEDTQHNNGEKGNFVLAIRNDTEGTLVGNNGDYAPLQVDALGRLRVAAEIDLTPGTEGDLGSDEAGDGEVPSIGTSAYVDVVTIAVAASTTYLMTAIDGCSDKLCDFRVVKWDSGQTPGAEVVAVYRKFLTPENIGGRQLVFPRPIEVVGGATISLKLQAKRLRQGATDANASGGINGYTL